MSHARHFSAGRIALFCVFVIAFLAWDGNRKLPSGPASGESLNGPPATAPAGDVLAVATYNIDGNDGDDTAAALKGFDLIGLEEVHGKRPFSDDNGAQTLGQKLNLPWLFTPVEYQWWHPAFGDGLLTDLPVKHWQRIPLSQNSDDSNREVLLATVQFGGQNLNVLVTHLERKDDTIRQRQFNDVVAIFESLQPPAILMGDLNSRRAEAWIKQLQSTPGVVDATGPGFNDKFPDTIGDWIFARGMVRINSGFIDNGASDHPLSWAKLSLAK